MKTAIVLTGGEINSEVLQAVVSTNPEASVIGIDGGCRYAMELGIHLELMIGDFDSLDPNLFELIKKTTAHCIRLDPVKNQTDTHAAFDYLVDHQYVRVIVLGTIGTRFDHTLGNVFVLMRYANKMQIEAINHKNRMLFIDGETLLQLRAPDCLEKGQDLPITSSNVTIRMKQLTQPYRYISIVPLERTRIGYTKGLKYPLENYELDPYDSYAISNEMENSAEIYIAYGKTLIIASND